MYAYLAGMPLAYASLRRRTRKKCGADCIAGDTVATATWDWETEEIEWRLLQ
jgi:hypothetical protein